MNKELFLNDASNSVHHYLRDYIFLEGIDRLGGNFSLVVLPNKIQVHFCRQYIFSRALSYTGDSPVVLILNVEGGIFSVGLRHSK